ncbi:MAG TPA: hypothetical protein VG496_11615 [Myxococcales bacterium]|nr:hypothetical protein [Myxococcales bacterium]
MRVVFVEQPGNLPPPPDGRVAVLDVAFAGGENFEKATLPFLESLRDRLAIWIDHHEHPLGWARVRGDPRFVLVPNREAHACPELVTPDAVARAGKVDAIVAHADLDGLLSAVKFLRGGTPPWPEADEDARAVDSPGRGHALSSFGRLLVDALDEAAGTLRSKGRESLRQEIVEGLVRAPEPLPPKLRKRLQDLQRAHAETLAPVDELADSAREEARGVLVVRVPKDLGRPVKKALLSRLEQRAPIGVVVEGRAVTVATFREELDLGRVDELTAGRSDYRFAQADDGGRAIVQRLGRLVEETAGGR